MDIDREETIVSGDDVYEFCINWYPKEGKGFDDGNPPKYGYIRKNNKAFAFIVCLSENPGFTVEAFHLLFERPRWNLEFSDKDINTVPFDEIIQRLP